MSDLNLSVVVTRNWLALGPLEINDGLVYRCSPQLLGALVSWNRQTVSSPYVDGAITVGRQLEMVNEPLGVEVHGITGLDATPRNTTLRTNMNALVAAFWQDSFTITITIDAVQYTYQAEAADVQMTWLGPRFMAKQGLITFTVPRQPRSLVDGLL